MLIIKEHFNIQNIHEQILDLLVIKYVVNFVQKPLSNHL
jgi:hypothetical protein